MAPFTNVCVSGQMKCARCPEASGPILLRSAFESAEAGKRGSILSGVS